MLDVKDTQTVGVGINFDSSSSAKHELFVCCNGGAVSPIVAYDETAASMVR